jgi:ribosomal protein L7/L12
MSAVVSAVVVGVAVFLVVIVLVARARRDETITMPGGGASTARAQTVEELILADRKIDAIRLLRAQTGLGLKAAKEEVEGRERRFRPR